MEVEPVGQMSAGSLTPDPRALFDLTGRVAVITGGGRGLGRSMSYGLARCGARIVAVGRTQSDLDATVSGIVGSGGEAIAVRADVGDYESLPGIVDATVKEFSGLDILVNNASDPRQKIPITEMTPAFVEEVYRTNVHGPTFLAQAAWRYLNASGHGSVINVLSVVVWAGRGGQAAFRGSKAALQHVSRTMAKEWAPTVRVNTLALGPHETSYKGGWNDEDRMAVTARTPLGRIAASEEVVPHVLYLASDAAAFVTGTDLVVDGGIANGK